MQPVQGVELSDVSMGPRLASQLLLQQPVCMQHLWNAPAVDPLNPATGSGRTGFRRRGSFQQTLRAELSSQVGLLSSATCSKLHLVVRRVTQN